MLCITNSLSLSESPFVLSLALKSIVLHSFVCLRRDDCFVYIYLIYIFANTTCEVQTNKEKTKRVRESSKTSLFALLSLFILLLVIITS